MGCGLMVVVCGLRVVGCGLWVVGCGLWVMGCGLWVVGCGLWVVGCGLWVVGYGFWVLGSGFWVLGSGCWVLGYTAQIIGLGDAESNIHNFESFNSRHVGIKLFLRRPSHLLAWKSMKKSQTLTSWYQYRPPLALRYGVRAGTRCGNRSNGLTVAHLSFEEP